MRPPDHQNNVIYHIYNFVLQMTYNHIFCGDLQSATRPPVNARNEHNFDMFCCSFFLLHNARSWIHYFRMHRDMKLLNTWEIMQYELYFWVASKFDWPHYVVATTWTYVRLSMVFAIEVPKHRVQFHPPKQVFLHFTNMEIVRFMRQLHSTTPNR